LQPGRPRPRQAREWIFAALAKRLKVDRGNVSRVLDLTLLAPAILDTIIDGKEPS